MYAPRMYLRKTNNSFSIYIFLILLSIIVLFIYPFLEKKALKLPESFAPFDTKFTLEVPEFLSKAKCHPLFCYENRWKAPHMFNEKINFNPTDYEATNYQCKSCEYGVGCMGFPKQSMKN